MSYQWSDGGQGEITVSGKKLECASWGAAPGSAPTLVLLHEGLGCVELWRGFPEQLAKATGLGVFAWSRAGYGRSDLAELPRPLDYMARAAEDDLPQVLEQIGAERVILLGHSDGASIVGIYAGSIADHRVRGLILMAPHFFTEPMGLAAIAESKIAFEQGGLRAGLAKYHRDAEHTFRGWNEAWLDPGFESWNIGASIDHWRIPVLAIQGRQDQFGTLAQITEIEDRIYSPVETAIIDECKHAPHLDQPELTLGAIQDFTTRLQRLEQESVNVT